MTTINKILSIKNVGKFKRYNAIGDVAFKKLNLIYGENGKGKTTLAEIFRSLKENSPNLINIKKSLTSSENPSVLLLTSTGRTTFNGQWTPHIPNIEIFDSLFVERNVHSGFSISSSQKQNLPRIVFGEKGGELLKEIKSLEEEEDSLKKEFSRKVDSLITKHQELFKITDVSQWEEYIKTGTIDETRTQILEKQKIQEALKSWKILNETKALDNLPSCNFDLSSFQEFMNKTIEGFSLEAERKVKEHIERHCALNSQWIETGLASIDNNICPFCGKSLEGNDLIELYKQYFNDTYKAFRQEVSDYEPQKAVNNNYQNSIKMIINKNIEIRNIWKEYIPFSEAELALKSEELNLPLNEIFNAINNLLNEKKANLFEQMSKKQGELLTHITEKLFYISEIIENYNIQIKHLNDKILKYKETLKISSAEDIETEIRKLRIKEICFQEKESIGLLRQMQNDKEMKTKKIKEKREELKIFSESIASLYAEDMNRFLSKCGTNFSIELGSPSFRGNNPSLNYGIKIDDVQIPLKADDIEVTPCLGNTLSEGDKTTLAFAFFLAKLNTDKQLSSKVIVIDDPISSLDNFRKEQTVAAIKKVSEVAEQTIIISHDFYFLNCFSSETDRKELEIACLGESSIIREFSLDEKTQSDQIKRLKKMQSYYDGTSSFDPADIARQIRPYLEGFLRRLFPDNFKKNQWLGDFINIIRMNTSHPLNKTFILEELSELNDFSKKFHHDSCEGCVTESVEDNTLKPFIKRTLDFNSFIFS